MRVLGPLVHQRPTKGGKGNGRALPNFVPDGGAAEAKTSAKPSSLGHKDRLPGAEVPQWDYDSEESEDEDAADWYKDEDGEDINGGSANAYQHGATGPSVQSYKTYSQDQACPSWLTLCMVQVRSAY